MNLWKGVSKDDFLVWGIFSFILCVVFTNTLSKMFAILLESSIFVSL